MNDFKNKLNFLSGWKSEEHKETLTYGTECQRVTLNIFFLRLKKISTSSDIKVVRE